MFTPGRLGHTGPGIGGSPMLSRNRSLMNRRSSVGSPKLDSSNWRSPGLGNSRRQSKQYSFSQNQSFQNSILVAESPNYIIEAFGSSLPVLVTEALTLSDRNVEVSVKLSETGWAWLVCNRRLFIWKYKLNLGVRPGVAYCKELTLPPSDLAHKAELVCIFVNKDSQLPSAVAVSPEGIVRYWSSVAHEVTSSEMTVDLQGQECYSLTNIQPLGCILATTTSSLVQIIPTIIDGQHTIVIQTMKVPQGVLAGIGKRVSSFIFGAMPNQSSESKQLLRVLAEDGDDEDTKDVYVLSGNTLQKWLLIADELEKMVFEVDIDRTLKDEILQVFACQESVHVNQLKTWLVDMQLSEKGIMVLGACIHPQDDQQMCYMLLIFDRFVPGKLSSFNLVKHTEQFTEWNEDQLIGFKFVMPDLKNQVAYFYNRNKVICVPLSKHNNEVDVLEFMNYEDRILGSGSCERLPLFFSSINGILSVVNVAADTSFLPSQSLMETSKETELEQMSMSEDKTAKLRAAFLYFCHNDVVKSQSIIEEDFMVSVAGPARIDSYLDEAVISLSQDMINDFPASDPRWAESSMETSSVSSSLLLLKQLNDKLRAHNLLMTFLKSVGLWQKLHQITMRGCPMVTRLLLCEHAEKLKAAIALRGIQSNILEQAIQKVLLTRKSRITSKLTPQDVFYQEISTIDDIYLALLDLEQDGASQSTQDPAAFVTSVNSIFLESLQPVFQFRQSNAHLYECDPLSVEAEYIPWSSTDGPSGLRQILMRQYASTVEHLNLNSEEISPSVIHQQLLDLADIILDGYRCQLESVKQNEERFDELNQKYSQDRNELITPLYEADQLERATALAEKYCDFGTLVKICEKTNNQDRLQRYMAQFVDQGFSDFVFKWYLEEGKRGRLLSQPSSQNAELSRFLENHESLSWLHHFNTVQFGTASNQLQNLALNEKHYMTQKKTMLSLSKLSLLASDESQSIRKKALEVINNEHNLLLYQETLPAPVLESCGLDLDSMRVLSPEEMIGLYISEDNVDSNEYDFKKALDLLAYCKKPENDQLVELRQRVWCQAILKDSWECLDTNNPLESVRNTVFFRVIELAFTQGVDLESFLLPVESLIISSELEHIGKDPNFVFLLKAGYEHVSQLLM